MEYKILGAVKPSELEDQVREHISQGWRPLGGISVTQVAVEGVERTFFDFSFYQAMIRE